MPTSAIAFDFFPASDNTLLVRFPGAASSDVNERVLGLWWQLQQRKQEYAILNLHPAY